MIVADVVDPMFTMFRQTGQWATAPNAMLAVVVVVVVEVAVAVLTGLARKAYSSPKPHNNNT